MILNDLLIFLLKRLGGPYPLYTTAPIRVSYPYISLEVLQIKHEVRRNLGKTRVYLQIQAWSRNNKPTEIQAMAEHIQNQLANQVLRMGDLGKASCRTLEESTKILNDRTTRLYHTKLLMGIRQ